MILSTPKVQCRDLMGLFSDLMSNQGCWLYLEDGDVSGTRRMGRAPPRVSMATWMEQVRRDASKPEMTDTKVLSTLVRILLLGVIMHCKGSISPEFLVSAIAIGFPAMKVIVQSWFQFVGEDAYVCV